MPRKKKKEEVIEETEHVVTVVIEGPNLIVSIPMELMLIEEEALDEQGVVFFRALYEFVKENGLN